MFQDLDDGEMFVSAVFYLCRDWKDNFHPPVGVIREKYWQLEKEKEAKGIKLPESTERWTKPPKEWLELKKKLRLVLADGK